MISDFHFIRPLWFLALLPLAFLAWALYRRARPTNIWQNIIAPHLLPHLLRGEQQRQNFSPLLLLSVGWLLTVIALAGPTWHREPAPFADDTAALTIVIKVTPSMLTEDIQPSRLTRGIEKIHDLLEQRKGAKACLTAYAGTAHVIMPLTTDAGIINTFAAALDPKIMPSEGDNADQALTLAEKTLGDSGGSMLWLTDSVPANLSTKYNLTILPLATGPELTALTRAADSFNATLISLTADDADVTSIARQAKFAPTAPGGGEKTNRWQESGYWLTPFLVLLSLPFFRRGWMLTTGGAQ